MHYLFIIIRQRLMLCLVCTSILHLSSRWNWKTTVGSRWTCFGVRCQELSRTLD